MVPLESLRRYNGWERRCSRTHPVECVGIGFGGPVNSDAGRTIISHQVEGWQDYPIRETLQQTFQRPIALGNDCDAAALAEATWGAGAGERRVFYVTVGTGVGGGFVIDGKLYGDDRPSAAEIGHLRPAFDGDEVESVGGVTVESIF